MACGACKKRKAAAIKEIYEGWKNYIFPNPRTEIVARTRANICSTCVELTFVMKESRKIPKCGLCGCPIAAKTRSLSSQCPDDPPKWLRE